MAEREATVTRPYFDLLGLARKSARLVVAVAALRFGTLLAVPLSLLGVGNWLWTALPLVLGAGFEFGALHLRQRLRRTLRGQCLTDAASEALGKTSFVPEKQVDSAFWAAHIAEHVVCIDLPSVAAAAAAGAAIATWTAIKLAPSAALALAGLVTLGTVLSLISNRHRARTTDAIVEKRQLTASLLAAAERDIGEIYGPTARGPLLSRIARHSAEWCQAVEVLERRQAVHRTLLGALLFAGLWLAARGQGIDVFDLREGTTLSVSFVAGSLLVACFLPAAYVFVTHLDSALVSRAELCGLAPPPGRSDSRDLPLESKPNRLCLRNLVHRYGEHEALRVNELDVELERVVVIVGPNGSGKTTLGALIVGVLTPSQGAVTLDGIPAGDVNRDQLAFVPQTPLILETLSVEENVRLVAPHADTALIERQLRALGFTRELAVPAGQLSRGEQRRVAIARAIVKDPLLLILDEPDSWLDAAGREVIAELLTRESRRRRVILISHRQDLVPAGATVIELGADHRLALDQSADSGVRSA